jgi:outer membrane immunogenic protein
MRMTMILAAALAASLAAPAAAETAGARVEALIGLDRANLDSFGSRDDPGDSGLLYGLGVGYDFEIGTGVSVGVDLEATDSSAGLRQTSGVDDNSFQVGRDFYAGGRVTVALSDSVNVYAKAGYTDLRTRLDLINPTFPEVIEFSRGGARIGAGAQLALGGKLYAGAEYRFSTYDELDRHQGAAVLGMRF